MIGVNVVSEKLLDQLKSLEINISETSCRFKDVEIYLSRRIKKLKRTIPLMAKSNNWKNKLSDIFDLFGEVEVILNKMHELENSITKEEILSEELDLIGDESYDGMAGNLE